MKELLLILFFSKVVLLTPNFIDINKGEDYIIKLNKPINAITTGASIMIDVTKMIPNADKLDIFQARDIVKKMFPKGSIEVLLIAKKKEIKLEELGSSFNKNNIRLILSTKSVPTDIDFTSVIIKSDVDLKDVKVYWRNYTH